MRRRNPTPNQLPPVQQALQEHGDQTQGHRRQSPRRQKLLAALAVVTLAPVGFAGGQLLGGVVKGDDAAKRAEQAKERLLDKEHQKYVGFSCDIGQIAMSPVTDVSSGVRIQIGVTVRDADHAALRAAAFDPAHPDAQPREVNFVPPTGAGGGQLATNTLLVPPEDYNMPVVVYAVNDSNASVRCVNGVEFRTQDPDSGAPVDPTAVNVGTDNHNYPDQLPF